MFSNSKSYALCPRGKKEQGPTKLTRAGPIEKISPCCMGEESSSSVDETTSMILARNKVCTILRVAVTFSAFSLREDIATVPHMRIQLVLEKS
jgi:hypothetical protein